MLQSIWQIIHDGILVRRACLGLSWYITIEAFHFCYQASEASGYDPATIGACVGILTPVSAMQAAVMKFYGDSRKS